MFFLGMSLHSVQNESAISGISVAHSRAGTVEVNDRGVC